MNYIRATEMTLYAMDILRQVPYVDSPSARNKKDRFVTLPDAALGDPVAFQTKG